MTRRAGWWLLMVLGCVAPLPTWAADAPRPNVLFIVVDDLRPELACYGAAQVRSPHIDRLASGGLLFERAYCQVAVCNPSRNSVLSGARPDTTKSLNNQTFLRQTLPDVVTLPEHFKHHGYTTLSLGKIFHHSEREPGDDPQSWSEPSWYHGTPYRHWFTQQSNDLIARLKKLPEGERPRLTRGPPYEAAGEPDDAYPDGQLALKAIETLSRLRGQPFFLGVGFHKPHLPFTCPQAYWDLYPADEVRVAAHASPTRGAPAPAFHDGYELRSYGGVPPQGPVSDEAALQLTRGYRACVSFVDAQIGRVLDALERLGLADNTLVVLWGDHGYHLGENGLWTKMTNFERGTRVPLIVRVPGQATAGQRTRALVELVDLYPTLVELCGLPLPPHLEGTSFAPLIDNPDRPWKQAAFSQYLRPGKIPALGRSIRTATARYTEWTDPRGRPLGTEYYDHATDPDEHVNLAAESRHEDAVADLARRLHAGWRAALPAP